MAKRIFSTILYSVARKIPAGKVATYGQPARLAGSPEAARAVGMCMSRNRDSVAVPCHRVVSADGGLTGYSMGNGVSTKREMLMREGVIFRGEKVDLEVSQWKP